MAKGPVCIVPLSQLLDGQEADIFALLAAKSEGTTRDGKPFWRVTFRDAWAPGVVSHLERLGVIRRLPRAVAGRHVLQAAGRLFRDEVRPAARHPQDSPRHAARTRPTASTKAASYPRSKYDSAADVRRLARSWPSARFRTLPLRELTSRAADDAPRDAAAAGRRPAESSRLRRRLSGARAERRQERDLPGRQVRPRLSRAAAAAVARPGRSRGRSCTTSARCRRWR